MALKLLAKLRWRDLRVSTLRKTNVLVFVETIHIPFIYGKENSSISSASVVVIMAIALSVKHNVLQLLHLDQ